MNWDPVFVRRSPMLAPLAADAAALEACADWPRTDVLQALLDARGVANRRGLPLRLVAAGPASALPYEARIYERGELEVREGGWHDLFNVLAWLAWPRTKAALNERHVRASAEEGAAAGGARRGRVRDALTLFDESGAIVACADPDLVEDLRAFRWRQLFVERRERVRDGLRVFVVGHALFEKALAPYVGLTAHALTLPVDRTLFSEPQDVQMAHLDERAAAIIEDPDALATPRALAPLPVLGVPGWWEANEDPAFYDNARYFRPGRRGAPSAHPTK